MRTEDCALCVPGPAGEPAALLLALHAGRHAGLGFSPETDPPAGSELLFLTLLLVGQFLKQEQRRCSFLGWIKSQSEGAAASARETRALVCPSSKALGGCRPSLHRTVWVLRERSPWQAAPQPAAEVTLEPCFAGRAHVSPCLSTSGPRAPLGGQLCPQGKPAASSMPSAPRHSVHLLG